MHMAQRKAEPFAHGWCWTRKSIGDRESGGGLAHDFVARRRIHLPACRCASRGERGKRDCRRYSSATTIEGRGGVIAQIENIARGDVAEEAPTGRGGSARRRFQHPEILGIFHHGAGVRAGGRAAARRRKLWTPVTAFGRRGSGESAPDHGRAGPDSRGTVIGNQRHYLPTAAGPPRINSVHRQRPGGTGANGFSALGLGAFPRGRGDPEIAWLMSHIAAPPGYRI